MAATTPTTLNFRVGHSRLVIWHFARDIFGDLRFRNLYPFEKPASREIMSQNKPQQQIQYHDRWPRFILKLSDSIAVVAGLFVLVSWMPDYNSKSTIVIALIAIGIFSMVAEFLGVYRKWRGIAFEREAVCSLIAWVITALLLITLGSVSIYSSELAGRAILFWFTVTPVFALSARILFRWVWRGMTDRGINTRSFAVVGLNELGTHLVNNVKNSPELGLKFLGYYDDRPSHRLAEVPSDQNGKLGEFSDLVDHAKRGEVEVVFISLPMRAEERIREVIKKLNDTTASVYIVPDLFVYQMLNSRWTDIQGLPVVSVSENPFYGVDGMLKRVCDVLLATIAIIVAAIPMLLIAMLVKLTSKGPVLFRQKRYGLDGKPIDVWKFRSMTVTENGDRVTQATKNDKRVTKVGGFLRKSSLDELPQLINVLLGGMSLVGPRPHANAHNEYYRQEIEGYMLRHKVKPGITGLAQVNGCRGETETIEKMENRVRFDHQYIREWSIWLDLKIMFQTVAVVLKRENAY